MPPVTYLDAIRQALVEEMDRDPAVLLMGEDIGVYGGAFKATAGLLERFGWERVIDTPISETAIVGAAVGMSYLGLRPVAEMQFIDFIACTFNQITNFVAKSHYRWGAPVPIVIRGPAGGGVHGSAFHSEGVRAWPVSSFRLAPPHGDDWLADDDALRMIAKAYEQFDCWMTYGSWLSNVPGPSGRPNGARNGCSASSVTIHGDTVVAKFFDRNGPRGWYSHAWMSRAVQSLKRPSPNT